MHILVEEIKHKIRKIQTEKVIWLVINNFRLTTASPMKLESPKLIHEVFHYKTWKTVIDTFNVLLIDISV